MASNDAHHPGTAPHDSHHPHMGGSRLEYGSSLTLIWPPDATHPALIWQPRLDALPLELAAYDRVGLGPRQSGAQLGRRRTAGHARAAAVDGDCLIA
eukprot:688030-Prymnesium_polylepis.1